MAPSWGGGSSGIGGKGCGLRSYSAIILSILPRRFVGPLATMDGSAESALLSRLAAFAAGG